mgnify:CR=1 FL=1
MEKCLKKTKHNGGHEWVVVTGGGPVAPSCGIWHHPVPPVTILWLWHLALSTAHNAKVPAALRAWSPSYQHPASSREYVSRPAKSCPGGGFRVPGLPVGINPPPGAHIDPPWRGHDTGPAGVTWRRPVVPATFLRGGALLTGVGVIIPSVALMAT